VGTRSPQAGWLGWESFPCWRVWPITGKRWRR